MTRVDFHVGAGDKLLYVARLVRKAYAAGHRVTVTGEVQELTAFDERLWTFAPHDFTPHVFAQSALAPCTPVVLASDVREAPQHEILVNMSAQVPIGFERYERLIEVVGAAEDQLVAGRTRYKHYRERGYPLSKHDIEA
jgi:DNA polymerase III subunit chi